MADSSTVLSVYDFIVKDAAGNDVSLEKYKGKVCIIVNIVSPPGLTPSQCKELLDARDKYKDFGLDILLFETDQFVLTTEEKICNLDAANVMIGDVYGKVNINGDCVSPLYAFLKDKKGGFTEENINWNFTKYVVDKNGQPIEILIPPTPLENANSIIEDLLKQE